MKTGKLKVIHCRGHERGERKTGELIHHESMSIGIMDDLNEMRRAGFISPETVDSIREYYRLQTQRSRPVNHLLLVYWEPFLQAWV